MRMGNAPPHLGLVVEEGELDSYSQQGGTLSERGTFLIHPGHMKIRPGGSVAFSWRLFWHTGWVDFFQRLKKSPHFVRLQARDYVVFPGENLEIDAELHGPSDSARLLVNGVEHSFQLRDEHLHATIAATTPGDIRIVVENEGRESRLNAYVSPPLEEVVDARVRFIVKNQQRNAQGDLLDGAYLAFDNETQEQIFNADFADHNAGRERIAMGVLGAVYLPLCRDAAFVQELRSSLFRYAEFLKRELEDEDGEVYERLGRRQRERLYNYPWAAHFHLALYKATKNEAELARFVKIMRAYYQHPEGARFYAIGIPAEEGIRTLRDAGRTAEAEELMVNLRKHAEYFLERGSDYTRSEVNFEQAIVAPAAQLLAEMYDITAEEKYLIGLKRQLPLLEAFAGMQPDSRLHEIAIRHWDDYWFGKLAVYGDTMPHYWSTLNAMVYAYYGKRIGKAEWIHRAETVLRGNLSLFGTDGSASAAHLYFRETNGSPGLRNDPWANDQDWALVNFLHVREMIQPASP